MTGTSLNLDPAQLEQVTGYFFSDKRILLRALTRLAFSKEQGLSDDSHLDALATLGDAVIELAILTRLVRGGEHDKGSVSLRKMDLVNMSVLREAARSIHLEQYVRWGKGEARMHVWTSGRVLAECMEAFAGAVYLDGGIDAAEQVLEKLSLLPDSPEKQEIMR